MALKKISRVESDEDIKDGDEESSPFEDDADADAINAENKDGVLYIAIPKREAAVTKSITVKVS